MSRQWIRADCSALRATRMGRQTTMKSQSQQPEDGEARMKVTVGRNSVRWNELQVAG